MCIEKLVRNAGFALASFGIVAALAASIEYLPVVNALAR
jgi:hypothetical protein